MFSVLLFVPLLCHYWCLLVAVPLLLFVGCCAITAVCWLLCHYCCLLVAVPLLLFIGCCAISVDDTKFGI
jgi:hypothetical protein